jgi:SM-20-related protein
MWLESFESPEEILVQQIFDSLKTIIRKEFYLPAKRFECHFAKYEPGSFYKVHQDRHQNKPGRLVSCVLYLNQCEKNAGNLVIYDEELRPIRINPSPGKIVVFDSSLEHEVTPTKSDRWSLTGWIRDDINPGLRI